MTSAVESLFAQLPTTTEPYVARSLIASWPACELWNLSYLSRRIHCPLKFRLARRECSRVQWEPECVSVLASVSEFAYWLDGRTQESNPFHPYPVEDWWAYADYVYMDRSPGVEELIDDLQWSSTFPFIQSSVHSTFWLGSVGAYSICHYDTYGVNLVAQLLGEKTWTLFPSSDSVYMYPTRLPYEESTVFSKVNFPKPDVIKHPLIMETSPRRVTLKPGDILFVPRGWWHFVQSTSDDNDISQATCAVNLWLDQPNVDDSMRVKEALTQLVGFSLLHNGTVSSHRFASLLHSTELELFKKDRWADGILDQIDYCVNQLQTKTCASPPAKCRKRSVSDHWKPLTIKSLNKLFPSELLRGSSHSELTVDRIVNAFMQPDVIDLVVRHLHLSK